MKILFLDTSPVRRGAQVFVQELSDFLKSNKLAETKRVYLYQASEKVKLKIGKNDLILDGNPNHTFEKVPTVHPLLVQKLIQCIRKYSPDLILLNGSRTLKYGAAAKGFLPKNIKMVSRVIDNAAFWNNRHLTQLYYKNWVFPSLDASIGVSHQSLDAMVKHYDFNKPSRTIHRAVHSEKFINIPSKEEVRKNLEVTSEDKVLLFLGNLTAQKRPDRFLELFRALKIKTPHLKAFLVGDGPMRKELGLSDDQEQRNQLREEGIYFWGYQENVGAFIKASDLLVLTSDTEGLPGVVLEAGLLEVPTISTVVGGIKECLLDGETGFLFEGKDEKQWIFQLENLLNQPSKIQKTGQKARKWVEENFIIEKIAQEYLEFFSQVIGKSEK